MHSNLRPIAAIGLAAMPLLSLGAAAEHDGGNAVRAAEHARATIIDPTGNEIGEARFVEDASGVLHLNVKAHGLLPGSHGIHIHAVGKCTPTFNDAGPHHNPLGMPHGGHAGDLPNLSVNPSGNGRLNSTTRAATLSSGPTSVFDLDGSAIIIHANADDFVTQPTGNSGARVACGVIVKGS